MIYPLLSKQHRLFSLLVLLLLSVVYFFMLPNGYVGQEHDDAIYVLASHSLWQGHYHKWYSPSRAPLTETTPGLPALLMPLTHAAENNLVLYQIYMWFWAMLAAVALWFWLRRFMNEGEAAVLTSVTCLNPLLLSRVGIVMPEIPSLAVVIAVFALLGRSHASPLVGGLTLLAYLIRPASFPLAAAVGLYYFTSKRWRDLAWSMGISLTGIAAWNAWAAWQGAAPQEIKELSLNYQGSGWVALAEVARHNAAELLFTWGKTFLPYPWAVQYSAPAGAAGAVLAVLVLRGAWLLRHKTAAEGIFVSACIITHLFWPWWYDRYLIVFLPFFALWLWGAIPLPEIKKSVLLALLVVFQFFGQGFFVIKHKEPAAPFLDEAYRYIQTDVSPKEVLASHFYARDVLYSGRLFTFLPHAASAEDLYAVLKSMKVSRVFWYPAGEVGFSLKERSPVADSINALPLWLSDDRYFQPLWLDPSGQSRVYGLLERDTPSANAAN